MTKRKKKFNFIDILIILILIGGLVFGLKKFNKANVASSPSAKSQKILISYYVEEVPSYAAESIEIGSPVREEVQSSNFGRVVDKKVDKSVSWSRDSSGQFKISNREGYNSLVLTMEAQGLVRDNGFAIDKSVYYIGQTLTLHAGNAILETGRISNVELVN